MNKVNINKELETVVTLIKTDKLIETLAMAEIKENCTFTPAEITRAFTETKCKPFSRGDMEFIKACLKSESLQALKRNYTKHSKEKYVKLAKIEVDTYNYLRSKIKQNFNGLIFYKD